MDVALVSLIVIAVLLLSFLAARSMRKKEFKLISLPDSDRQHLQIHVLFYDSLDMEGKKNFESRVQHFLLSTKITGAGTVVEAIDRILIGASAIIPIYAFPGWQYVNLDEVILYPGTFNLQFAIQGENRSVLGMVGDGPMQRTMILSQAALREGFSNKTDKNNTAIHEFVHLIDKTDGATDGVPEILIQHRYVLPWLNMMQQNMKDILANHSDINPYGATNQAEFFAVAAEYFFEQPALLKTKHPELYGMLKMIFSERQ